MMMRGEDKIFLSGGEVRVISLLDKLAPQFWVLENQLRTGGSRPALIAEMEERMAHSPRAGWLWKKGHGAEEQPEGEVLPFDAESVVQRHVRRGEQLQAEAFQRAIVAVLKGIVSLAHTVRGLVKGLVVTTDDLVQPPFSR